MRDVHLAQLEWAQSVYGAVRHNLADSAVQAVEPSRLGLVAPLSADARGERDRLERGLGERLGAPSGRVSLAAGASEANACVFAAILEPGDDVLVERPGYGPLSGVPPLFHARTLRYARRPQDGYAVLAREVDRSLTPRTRLVVVTDLHNPSGAALEERGVAELSAMSERHGFFILCDEAYRESDVSRPVRTAAANGSTWIATGSLTKTYGLGGLRLGWVAAQADVLARCAAARNAFSVEPAHAGVQAGLALLPRLDELRTRAASILEDNRAFWRATRERLGIPADTVESRGSIAWCPLGHGDEGNGFAEYALREHDVAVTPGRFFEDPSGFRISLGAEPEVFRPALEALESAYQEWSSLSPSPGGTP